MFEPLAAWYILPAALALDVLLGNPRWMPHAVRLMGWSAERLEPPLRKTILPLGVAGALFTGILVAAAYVFTLFAVKVAGGLHPVVGIMVELALVYTCLAARCLY